MTKHAVACGVALFLLVCGCTAGTTDHPYLHSEEQPLAAEWSYTGRTGPAHWADLSDEYRLAKFGRHQSPIDISDAIERDLTAIEFSYRPASVNLVYNGHTIEELVGQASSIEVDGKKYSLQQFHFHSPSEHTFNGRPAEMEMHLVHQSADGDLAVVGVMINARAETENAAFAPIWDYLPNEANRKRTEQVTVDAESLLPANREYFRYMGSLTTPPCTEDVLWLVLRSPVELSEMQIEEFRSVLRGNNRPVQALNGRAVAVSR